MSDAASPPSREAAAAQFEAWLAASQWKDRPALSGQWRRWLRSSGADADRIWHTLARQAAASVALVAARRAEIPAALLAPPAELPIAACVDALRAAFASDEVTIVCGSTGSGKSTQLPKLALALGRGVLGRIGVTQPRRLAARAIAARLASELRSEPGALVGFHTRFEQQLTPATRVKVMTDGILLQELARDRLLLAYDTLIVDEVHERSVNIDFLLAYLRKLRRRRRDLKLVLTSATLEAERCAEFFGDAHIVRVPGRSFPVEIRYRAPAADTEGDLVQPLLAAIAELDAEDYGDILVFLPGEREIAEIGDTLGKAGLRNTAVLPLYARLGAREQQRVFAPHRERHVILATNVAETSLTVPGVRHVIDSGLVRLASYSPRSRLQRLPTVPNSQASAAQRAGRCGRERPGICIRLYAEDDHAARPLHTPPELQRSNLAGVMLRLAELGLGAIEDFEFLDPPAPRAVADGQALLRELGAFDTELRLTKRGARLARLPLDPRLGAALLAAGEQRALGELLVIVAALSAGDVREWPREQREAAAKAHAAEADRRSEFMWFLQAWQEMRTAFDGASRRQQMAWCRARFWSWRRAREWLSVHAQLSAAVRTLDLVPNATPASYRAVHTALLAGFATRVGRLGEDKERPGRYLGTRGGRFRLHPSSSLRAAPPKWVVAAELTETTAAYARIAARIEPAWIATAAAALVRRSHDDPVWDAQRGRVLAREEVSLQGLVLSADARVDYARVDALAARELFVTAALVDGDFGAALPPFLAHNLALMDRLRAWEARVRRHDLLADRAQLAAFYTARLPAPLASRRQLLRWLEEDPARDATLRMQERDASRAALDSIAHHLFPESLRLGELELALAYRFDPGAEDDGVTVDVPAALLHRLDAQDFDRLVPGLLRERVHALLKTLPKARRRLVSPLNEFAQSLTAAIDATEGSLLPLLVAEIERMTGSRLDVGEFRPEEVPAHLRMRYRILGADGQPLAAGRELAELAREHARAARRAFDAAAWPRGEGTRSGVWIFGTLPAELRATVDGHLVVGHPALRADGETVRVEVEPDAAQAAAIHRQGVVALLMQALPRELKSLKRRAAEAGRLALQARALGWSRPFADWLAASACAACVGAEPPRDEAAWAALLEAAARRDLGIQYEALLQRSAAAFAQAGELQQRLAQLAPRLRPEIEGDLRAQIETLAAPDTLADGALAARLPRYLRALALRLERLAHDPEKDRHKFASLAPLLARSAALTHAQRERLWYWWQELRIAIFAPEVRTAEPVSIKRMESLLDEFAALRDDAPR
ncbi:MAG TPA: ATP-dependent RNA helicase HrpA [Gammaproteobacteria bacterium]|nr:ATP-dependent RNA helicase HrpA [Gammaproteobacteria bacterium]